MKPRDKQAYLEEYELLKKKGKPFFPYAVLKDSAMALIVVGVIIAMSVVLGAEQGPKADPTTTTYVPRPEWYFFFLFEVLRVIKPPELVPIATIGIPTICMVLLLLLPFYDRGPERRPERRPIATTAGCLTIVAMAYLTYLGATGGSPTEIDMKVAPQYEAGKEVVAGSGCLACHKLGENGNNGPGPGTDPHRRSGSRARRSCARWKSARVSCPPSANCRRRSSTSSPISSPHSTKPSRDSAQFAEQVNRMFDRVAARYDAAELGDDRRAAPSLARAGRRPRRARRQATPPWTSAAEPATWRSSWPTGSPRRPRGRLRLLRADARPGPREGDVRRRRRAVRFEWADALSLPYDAGRFDAVTVGFGVRNLADLDRGLREMARVLRPGGRLVILEITQPHPAAALDLLLALVRPRSSPCSAPSPSDPEAYSYLPESVRSFPGPRGLAEKMDAAGLERIRCTVLAGGIIAIHSGVRG